MGAFPSRGDTRVRAADRTHGLPQRHEPGPRRRGTRPDTATDEPTGFAIRGELARGGMGVVYQAYDRAFGRDVAVKVLLPEWRDVPEAVSRFATEGKKLPPRPKAGEKK